MAQPKYTLNYFDIRGRAEPTRLAFAIGHIPFTDNRISFEEWGKMKISGKQKFSQLPTLEFNGKQYAQSRAILRYVGRIANLYPQTYEDALIVDEGVDLVDELFVHIAKAAFHVQGEQAQIEARKQLVDEQIPPILSAYEKQTLKNKSGYYGEKLSIADLFLYEAIKWITEGTIPHVKYDLNQHKGLVNLFNQISAIPEVKEWYSKHK